MSYLSRGSCPTCKLKLSTEVGWYAVNADAAQVEAGAGEVRRALDQSVRGQRTADDAAAFVEPRVGDDPRAGDRLRLAH